MHIGQHITWRIRRQHVLAVEWDECSSSVLEINAEAVQYFTISVSAKYFWNHPGNLPKLCQWRIQFCSFQQFDPKGHILNCNLPVCWPSKWGNRPELESHRMSGDIPIKSNKQHSKQGSFRHIRSAIRIKKLRLETADWKMDSQFFAVLTSGKCSMWLSFFPQVVRGTNRHYLSFCMEACDLSA